MKLLDRPELPHYLQESYTRSKPIQDAILDRIAALEDGRKTPSLADFSETKRTFIAVMAKKRLATPELQRMYIDCLDETRQVFSRPMITDDEFDTFAALDQPEMLDAFAKWEYPRGSRGFTANPTCTKALMTQAALGKSAHIRSVRTGFMAQPGLQQVFAHLEEKVAAIAGRDAKPCQAKEYSVCLDQVEALSSTGFDGELLKANIEMLKALRDLYPKEGICEIALCDGTDVAAWVQQISSGGDEDREAAIRGRAEHAGYRYIPGREITEIGDDGTESVSGVGRGKEWRGYYLVVLVCVKSGLPIVWTMFDAKQSEANAVETLLKLLYELWPDCPLKTIVADKAWDFERYHRVALVNYGVHLVAIQSKTNEKLERNLTLAESKSISGYTGQGIVYCRTHGEPMTFVGSEFGSRAGLTPGQPAPLSAFRVRYRCDKCGKTASLPTRGITPKGSPSDWNVFTHYPHNPLGQPKRFAERAALETRRNTVESFFGALKTVCQLALKGASRQRLTNFDTVFTLISLAFTVRTAQVIAAERIRDQLYPAAFPPNLLGGRKMMTS